jgi:hypothetical protein
MYYHEMTPEELCSLCLLGMLVALEFSEDTFLAEETIEGIRTKEDRDKRFHYH